MFLSGNDNNKLIFNLNRILYRAKCESIVNTKKSSLSSVQRPYNNNIEAIECWLKTPITEIQHRDCVICHLDQKLEKYNDVNDKKTAFIAVLDCCVAICSAISLLIVATSATSFILTPIFIALLSIACVVGLSSALVGVAILANRFLLKTEEAELNVSIVIANFLQCTALNIDMPRGVQNAEVLQTNIKDLDRLIREDKCTGSMSKLIQLYHKLDSLEQQQDKLRARIDSEVNPKKKEAYNNRLIENSENIELKYKAVKTLSEILYTKIFSGLEGMYHQDYKEEFIKNKYQYILELTSSTVFSANLYGMIFIDGSLTKESIDRFQSSKFFKALLSGVSSIEEKNLFRSIN
jgi:hypothetical protein